MTRKYLNFSLVFILFFLNSCSKQEDNPHPGSIQESTSFQSSKIISAQNEPGLYPDFLYGTIISRSLKLRTIPFLDGELIDVMKKSTRVKIVGRTELMQEIDGFFDYWLNVEYDNKTGWAWGGYIEPDLDRKLIIKLPVNRKF